MSEDAQVIDIFERAVADVPAALLPAPHAAIRRRIRWRRATRWGAATAVVLATLAGIAMTRSGPVAVDPVPAQSEARPKPWVPAVPWHTARIDRTGTRITVYAMPLPGKCVERDPAGDRTDRSDRGVALYLAGSYTGCRDDTKVTTALFQLPQTVGDRAVLDAREPAGQRVVFRDAELPDLAAGGWTEQPATWVSPGAGVLVLRYTRPGGPELRVHAFRCGCDELKLAPPDHTLGVDGHSVDLYDRPGGLMAGWWSVIGWVRFTLSVEGPIEKSEFEEIVRGMTWS